MADSPVTATTFSRPFRIAYLLDRATLSIEEVDNIVRHSVEQWGGKFHVILPVDSPSSIAPQWWNLLRLADPDFIISTSPLDEKLIAEINRMILPAGIILISSSERERLGDRWPIIQNHVSQLGISTVPRNVLLRWESDDDPLFLFIKDKRAGANGAFALRNFGALPDVLSTSVIFKDLPCEELDLQKLSIPEILERTIQQQFRLAELPQGRQRRIRVILPIDLCRFFTSKWYHTSYENFVEGFHLVVGDTPDDVIYSWNRGLVADSTYSRNTLWLSEEVCSDDAVIQAVGQWITRSFWDTDKFGRVVSYSVSADRLKAIARALAAKTGMPFQGSALEGNQFPIPREVHSQPIGTPGEPFARSIYSITPPLTVQVALSNGRGLVDYPKPLQVLPNRDGGWMVDLELEYRPERFSHWNHKPVWKLPKRLGIAHLFLPNRSARIGLGNSLSTNVKGAADTLSLRVPTDYEIVHPRVTQWIDNVRPTRLKKAIRFPTIEHSREGRALDGLLRIFGGLEAVGQIFEDQFWRLTLMEMAGKSARQEAISKLQAALQEEVQSYEQPLVPGDTRFQDFAERVWGRLRVQETQPETRTEKDLRDAFSRIHRKDRRPWDEPYIGGKRDLEYLLNRRVLLQGASIRCPVCYTEQWYDVDTLKSRIRCSGCLSRFPLPLSPQWSFRLNSMVANALREGTLPVAHALRQLGIGSSESLLFVPPQDVYPANGNERWTDVDLLGVVNQKMFIGEVKASVTGFKQSDFQRLEAVAVDWNPDLVVIAAEGDKWSTEAENWMESLRGNLEPHSIKVFPMLLDWDATSFTVP